jgi:hypothetical protein
MADRKRVPKNRIDAHLQAEIVRLTAHLPVERLKQIKTIAAQAN